MKVLSVCKPDIVYLAGFDGFSENINNNYYTNTMRKVLNQQQAEQNNKFYTMLLHQLGNKMKIEFITPSLYQTEASEKA